MCIRDSSSTSSRALSSFSPWRLTSSAEKSEESRGYLNLTAFRHVQAGGGRMSGIRNKIKKENIQERISHDVRVTRHAHSVLPVEYSCDLTNTQPFSRISARQCLSLRARFSLLNKHPAGCPFTANLGGDSAPHALGNRVFGACRFAALTAWLCHEGNKNRDSMFNFRPINYCLP